MKPEKSTLPTFCFITVYEHTFRAGEVLEYSSLWQMLGDIACTTVTPTFTECMHHDTGV